MASNTDKTTNGPSDGDRKTNASGVDQEEAVAALKQRMDRRFQRLERRSEEILDHLDALNVNTNGNRNDDMQRLKERRVHGQLRVKRGSIRERR
ncbi:hypothetical protein CDL15_Pgr004743 [Punica granatum]|nr:hypothetical protein CDL15_Pgr004743 [Punica granatum]